MSWQSFVKSPWAQIGVKTAAKAAGIYQKEADEQKSWNRKIAQQNYTQQQADNDRDRSYFRTALGSSIRRNPTGGDQKIAAALKSGKIDPGAADALTEEWRSVSGDFEKKAAAQAEKDEAARIEREQKAAQEKVVTLATVAADGFLAAVTAALQQGSESSLSTAKSNVKALEDLLEAERERALESKDGRAYSVVSKATRAAKDMLSEVTKKNTETDNEKKLRMEYEQYADALMDKIEDPDYTVNADTLKNFLIEGESKFSKYEKWPSVKKEVMDLYEPKSLYGGPAQSPDLSNLDRRSMAVILQAGPGDAFVAPEPAAAASAGGMAPGMHYATYQKDTTPVGGAKLQQERLLDQRRQQFAGQPAVAFSDPASPEITGRDAAIPTGVTTGAGFVQKAAPTVIPPEAKERIKAEYRAKWGTDPSDTKIMEIYRSIGGG